MKLLSIAAVSSALVATTASAEVCTIQQLTAIMTTQYTMPCMTGSGLDLTKLTGTPSQALMMKFCKTETCVSLLKAVLAQNPPDCTVPVSNVPFRSQLFDPLAQFCSASGASGSVNAGDAGATSPNATASATHSPNNSSKSSSSATHAGSGSTNTMIEDPATGNGSLPDKTSGGSLSDADSSTPAALTTAPTPTPKSGATSLAVSACAGILGAVALVLVL